MLGNLEWNMHTYKIHIMYAHHQNTFAECVQCIPNIPHYWKQRGDVIFVLWSFS